MNAVVVMFDREVFCTTLIPELSTRVEESVSTQSKKVEYFIVAMQNAAQDTNVRTLHYFQQSFRSVHEHAKSVSGIEGRAI